MRNLRSSILHAAAVLICQHFIAGRDVDIVRRSTKGIGTNEINLVNTLCNRTKKQLDAADLLYHKKVNVLRKEATIGVELR